MKPTCRMLQERLAEAGAEALRDDALAQRHLEECEACFAAMEGLARLDVALRALPAVDAPQPVVDALLAQVGRAAEPVAPRRRVSLRPFVYAAAGLGFVALGASVMVPILLRARVSVMDRRRDQPAATPVVAEQPPATVPPDGAGVAGGPAFADKRARELNSKLSELEDQKVEAYAKAGETAKEKQYKPQRQELDRNEVERLKALGYLGKESAPRDEEKAAAGKKDGFRYNAPPTTVVPEVSEKRMREDGSKQYDTETSALSATKVKGPDVPLFSLDDSLNGAVRVGGTIREPKLLHRAAPVYPALARQAHVQGVVILEVEVGVDGRVTRVKVLRSNPLLDAAAIEAVKQYVYEPTLLVGKPVPVILTVTLSFGLDGASPSPSSDGGVDSPARAFLAERAKTEGLSFQDPRGYWGNTYLPGDPALRVLRARLANANPSEAAGLHEAAAAVAQPFDPPSSAALALYLHADTRALPGPRRTLVQVGLQASPRRGRTRPPLNLAVVLDLRGALDVETAADMRALAVAFAEARRVGDRFSLLAAGHSGVVVGPDDFRLGPVSVALDALRRDEPGSEAADLTATLSAAYRAVCATDATETALGTSAVVLVTSQPLEDPSSGLVDLAHQGALAGIPLSVFAVGHAPLDAVDRLALAGQGSRRALESRADATRLVEQELLAAGDVVARAVRLRIRLAPGVRLVEVVGSERLDAVQAERVRESERTIDLQVARLLGLDADRGKDEDGIQIVIPAFHAGDSHVVLLDVVAPGPGPVADVTLRCKDLVLMRNGVVRGDLSLPRGKSEAGPLETAVLENLLALRLAADLTAAGQQLQRGDSAAAETIVARARALRADLGTTSPALAANRAIARDVAMLDAYLAALGGSGESSRRAWLADSLRYAAWLKHLPASALRST